jgi:hypothetical protein
MFVELSTKPIGVVEVAWLGEVFALLKAAQPVPLVGPVLPQTSIGLITM